MKAFKDLQPERRAYAYDLDPRSSVMVEQKAFVGGKRLEREVLELKVGGVGRSQCPLPHPREILREQHDTGV